MILTEPIRRFFDFQGRSGRMEFWGFNLIVWPLFWLLVIAYLANYLGDIYTAAMNGEALPEFTISGSLLFIGLILSLVSSILYIPSLAVATRRLHDTNRGIWWLLLSLLPIIGWIWLFILLCLRGSDGDNDYGPDLKTSGLPHFSNRIALEPFRRYFDFHGRSGRQEFWVFILLSQTIFHVLWTVADIHYVYVGYVDGLNFGSALEFSWLRWGIISVLGVLFAIPHMSLTFRRLHDTGRSGWWLLLLLLPIIGAIWLFVLFCFKGQAEVNKYGASPEIG